MKIKVGDYTLVSDSLCMWVTQEIEQKNGVKVDRRVSGYFPTFQSLMEDFCKRRIRGSGAEDIKQLVKEVAQMETDAVKLVNTAMKEGFALDKKR